jgi:quercetin dioxygenase-like cupin family protein
MKNIQATPVFLLDQDIAWETVGDGIKRKILGYDKSVMMVNVSFKKGAVGAIHEHYHTQVSYVLSGKFEVQIGNETKVLQQGDCFFVNPNTLHGAICLEDGALLDLFSPVREDFLG